MNPELYTTYNPNPSHNPHPSYEPECTQFGAEEWYGQQRKSTKPYPTFEPVVQSSRAPEYGNLHMNHTNKCLERLAKYQGRLYKHFGKTSDKHNFSMRLLLPGFGLAVASATLSLVFRVGAVGEVIFKATGNIVGGLFLDPKCDVERGLEQLIVKLPEAIYEGVVTIVIKIPLRGAWTLVNMVVCPATYCKDQKADHYSDKEMLKNANALTHKQKKRFQAQSEHRLKWFRDLMQHDSSKKFRNLKTCTLTIEDQIELLQ